MKKILFSAIALAVSLAGYAQWKPAGDKIKTTWAEQIDPNNVLPEYPRPIMERKEWKNLNGLWEYAVRRVLSNRQTWTVRYWYHLP